MRSRQGGSPGRCGQPTTPVPELSPVDPSVLRSLRWTSLVGAVVLGVVALVVDVDPSVLPVVAAYAGVMVVSLAVSRRSVDLRPWLAVDGSIGVIAVVATGGADSPLLLALLGPMLLAGILRSVAVTGVLLVAAAPAMLAGAPFGRGASTFGAMVVVAIVGSSAERLLGPRPEPAPVLIAAAVEHQRIERLTALLDTLEQHLSGDDLATSPRSRLLTIRRWMELVDGPDVIALREGSGAGIPWRMLGADDEVRDLGVTTLPLALLREEAFAEITLLPHIDVGTGLDPTSRRAAYLWLTADGEPREVLALEWPLPRSFEDEEAQFLMQLRNLFDLHRTASERLVRIRERTERSERFALAATLHDRIAQDLVFAAMEAERAARRHPGDPSLSELAPVIRDAVAVVRTTITDLRRAAAPPPPHPWQEAATAELAEPPRAASVTVTHEVPDPTA